MHSSKSLPRILYLKGKWFNGAVFVLGMAAGALSLSLIGGGYQIESPGARRLPPNVQRLLHELESIGLIEKFKMLNVPRDDGVFLRMLVEMTGATKALEIGTSNGYSSIWIGLGLQSTRGKLTTLEIDSDKVKKARENFRKAGLHDTVTVIEGDALKNLPELEGPFDFVFIDAWKEDYLKYFKMVFPKVTDGGLIIGHNAVEHASSMKDYLDTVARRPDLETIIVSTTSEDGMAISLKVKRN